MGIPSYADRMAGVSGSAVREILKLTQQPDIISFGGGLPSADSFPMESLKEILHEKLFKKIKIGGVKDERKEADTTQFLYSGDINVLVKHISNMKI